MDVCREVVFGKFPIGDEIRVVIRVVAVHPELFVLNLLEAMEDSK